MAIKTIALDAAGVQEQDSMIKVQQVLETQAGPHHLAELVGTYLQPDPDTGAATHILIVTRYPPWPSSFFSALPKQSSATWPHLHLTLPPKVLRNLLEESSEHMLTGHWPCRYIEAQDMGDSFAVLYDDLVTQAEEGKELQQGRRLYLNAVREAFRQLLKVGLVLSSLGFVVLQGIT